MIAIVTIEINGRTSPGPWPSATIKEELRKLVNDDGHLLRLQTMSNEEWEDTLPEGWTNTILSEDGKEHRNDEEDDCD